MEIFASIYRRLHLHLQEFCGLELHFREYASIYAGYHVAAMILEAVRYWISSCNSLNPFSCIASFSDAKLFKHDSKNFLHIASFPFPSDFRETIRSCS